MGLVSDIYWNCPGCGSREQAQTYADWDSPREYPVDSVPADVGLKYAPPCSNCGKYRLSIPTVMVKCVAVEVKDGES